jgi:hypothetical protein
MPGVRISIKDVVTGQVRTAVTDMSGSYSLPALPAGKYEMTVSALGFVTQLWAGITVTVGSQRILDILMRAGSSEMVVRATVPGASSTQSSGNVDNSVVQNTPLNGRDWTQLATLQAGVTGVQTGSASGGGNTERGFGAPISISGARPDQNSYRLDGISINDYSNGVLPAASSVTISESTPLSKSLFWAAIIPPSMGEPQAALLTPSLVPGPKRSTGMSTSSFAIAHWTHETFLTDKFHLSSGISLAAQPVGRSRRTACSSLETTKVCASHSV